MRYSGILFGLLTAGLILGGCSEKRDDPSGPDAHPSDWMKVSSENFHGARVASRGVETCLECHTLTTSANASEDALEMSCSQSNCHGVSGSPSVLACASCHDDLPPSHEAHVGDIPEFVRTDDSEKPAATIDVLNAEFEVCASCHATAITTNGAPVDSLHMNGSVNVGMSTQAGGTFDSNAMTCTNSYCHGVGDPNVSPAWASDANLTCESCHTIAGLPGIHSEHFAAMANNCSVCHSGTAVDSTAIASMALHANFEVDVEISAAYLGTFDENAMTCSGTYCHGTAVTTTAWNNPTPLDCESCHSFSELPGAHSAHLGKVGNDCSVCHADVAGGSSSLVNPGLHVNKTVDVEMNAEAGGTYSASTMTCAGTACHGALSPAWQDMTELNCNSCHPKVELPEDHQAHFKVMAGNCEVCHAATATDSTAISNPANHINFTVDVEMESSFGGTYASSNQACSGTYCHGVAETTPSWGGATELNCESCHAFAELPAPHQEHLAQVDNDCSVCHGDVVSGNSTIINPALHANQTVNVALDSQVGGTWDSGTMTCSDTYCHVDSDPTWAAATLNCQSCHSFAQLPAPHAEHLAKFNNDCSVCHAGTATSGSALASGDLHINFAVDVQMSSQVGGSFDAGTNTCSDTYCHVDNNPTWATASMDCQSCHGFAQLPVPHDTHLAKFSNNCSYCHTGTTTDGASIANEALHVNFSVDVDMAAAVGGSYTKGTNSCSGTYCHGDNTPTWATATLTCQSCHASDALPVSHPAHFAAMEQNCETCHSATATDSTAISNSANHVNFTADVVLAGAFGGTFDDGAMTCNNTYCHGAAVTTTSWTSPTALDCQGCHPVASLPDQHQVHVTKFSNDCTICHAETANSSTSLLDRGKHANMVNDVALNSTWGGSYDNVAETCSNTWCHGPENSVVSPTWTGSTDLDCQGCHPSASLTGGHNAPNTPHVGFGCATCHSSVVSNNTTVSNAALHVNNSVDVDVNSGTMEYNSGTQTCGGGTCHNPGPSPNWYTFQ